MWIQSVSHNRLPIVSPKIIRCQSSIMLRSARKPLNVSIVHARLLAGRSRGARSSDAAARGDESAGASVAAVRSESPGPRHTPTSHPDRLLRAQGTPRTRLLVCALPNPQYDLRRYDPKTREEGSRHRYIAAH